MWFLEETESAREDKFKILIIFRYLHIQILEAETE